MLYPEINKLRDAAGSRYFLVSMAAKRARDLIDGSPKLDENITTNIPVSIAAEEISQGLFTYTMLQEEYEEEEYIYEEDEYLEEEEAEAEEIEADTDETL